MATGTIKRNPAVNLSNVYATNAGETVFEFANGFKLKIRIGKLNATTNYAQFWAGQNLTDRGYITFDVSRNIDDPYV